MHFTAKERIDILIMRGFDDYVRSYEPVVRICLMINILIVLISKSTIYRTVLCFERTGSVKNELKCGKSKPAINNKTLVILQTLVKNFHTSVSKVAQQNDVSKISVQKILKKNDYHAYKINQKIASAPRIELLHLFYESYRPL